MTEKHETGCECTRCTIYKDEDTKKPCGHPIDDVNPLDRFSCYYCVEEATDEYAEEMDELREQLKDGDDRINDHATAIGMYDHDDIN